VQLAENPYRHLLYAGGWLLAPGDVKAPEGWPSLSLGSYRLSFAPGWPVGSVGPVVVFGRPVNPQTGAAGAAYAAEMLAAARTNGRFLEGLDQLAGRFLVCVNADEGLEVYQDAAGTRAVFYRPPVAASHSALAQRHRGTDAQVSTRLGFPVTAGHIAASRYAEVDGVPYHRLLPGRMLPRPSDKLLAADVEATAHLVGQLQPAVLHAHSKYVNAQIALALRDRFGLPVVYEVRGFLEETWRSRGRDPHSDSYQFSRAIESECMSAADAVVTISEGMKDEIIARGVPAERITVIPNAVDDSFLAEAQGGERVRRKLGINPGDLLVGVVTTLNRYEGIDVLIDAVAELRRDRVPTRLLVVGDGPERLALAEYAARQGLNGSAIFTGQVPFDAVRAYHAAIDVFCVPRRDTPVTRLVTPLKPLEAMATGRPVVASDLPPLREIVQPQRTGSLVTPEDSDALADALERFASNPSQRYELGKQAQLWTAQNRTWAAAAERYSKCMTDLEQPSGHSRPYLPADVPSRGCSASHLLSHPPSKERSQ
jgi:glycosyltransferase involved in cell wall biosynthesis